ncbi:uncharacterized protein RAG0_14001 [Rhynchosporium agropyri]|uniref:Uncharacterized protein n=1 Tax=Rhynchosporium agropyri TaxID=914238 RepID=A0A1E1LF40_9HELO|nr:uncharacterized protein RAG0_14001 [Rhynchosporium agropyri]
MDAPEFFYSAFDRQVVQNTTLSTKKPRQASITQRPRNSSVSSISSISSTSSYYSCSSRRSSYSSRSPLLEKYAPIGSLAYLPEDENTTIQCAQTGCGKKIELPALGHPVFILKKWKSEGGEIMTRACTASIRCSRLFHANERDKARNLPIFYGTSRYPSFNPEEVMRLERSGTLTKQSYIQVKHVYEIPLSKLAPFNSQRFENRLSEQSYSYLMSVLGLEKAHWTPTSDLESGIQETLPTTANAEISKITTAQKIITPVTTFISKVEKALPSMSLNADTASTVQVPQTQKKKGKKNKFVAISGHDFFKDATNAKPKADIDSNHSQLSIPDRDAQTNKQQNLRQRPPIDRRCDQRYANGLHQFKSLQLSISRRDA